MFIMMIIFIIISLCSRLAMGTADVDIKLYFTFRHLHSSNPAAISAREPLRVESNWNTQGVHSGKELEYPGYAFTNLRS